MKDTHPRVFDRLESFTGRLTLLLIAVVSGIRLLCNELQLTLHAISELVKQLVG
jgi:hypothetical protein